MCPSELIFYFLPSVVMKQESKKVIIFYDFLLPNLFSFSFLASIIWTTSPTAARVIVSVTLTDDILFINLCAKCDPCLIYPLILFSLFLPVTQTC